MKNVLVALVCTVGAVACGGENRPAENPAPANVSYTTETTTTSSAADPQRAPVTTAPATPSTMTPSSSTAARNTPPATPVTPAPATPATPAPGDTSSGMTGGAVATNNPGAADGTKDATNTKVNDRDRHGALTPMDQGGGKDRDITAAIRKAVVGDGSLSFNAKNVKIITVGGKVTLRGPVKTDAEKATIESKAKSAAGVVEVDNQLEVKK